MKQNKVSKTYRLSKNTLKMIEIIKETTELKSDTTVIEASVKEKLFDMIDKGKIDKAAYELILRDGNVKLTEKVLIGLENLEDHEQLRAPIEKRAQLYKQIMSVLEGNKEAITLLLDLEAAESEVQNEYVQLVYKLYC